MWTKLPLADHSISFNVEDEAVELYLTDFISIWYKCFSKSEFITCLKASNRLLEIEESVLFDKAVDMLKNVHTLSKVQTSKDQNNCFLLEITRMEGFPVRLRMSLNEGSKAVFFFKVTQLMIQTINDLRSSEKELIKKVREKDKEIKEYKEEGGKIALRHLKTPHFDEGTHLKAHSSYANNFGVTDLPLYIISRVEAIKEEPSECTNNTAAVVKLEPASKLGMKQEPSSQSSSTSPRKRKKVLDL